MGLMLQHGRLHGLGRGRAALGVDVEAVRLGADLDHLRAQLPQELGRHAIGGAMGAVDHDAQASERHALGQGRLQRLDVALAPAIHADHAAERVGRCQALVAAALHALLDRQLDRIRQLVAVGAEQLDAIVLVGIVRCRDHHADVGPQRAGQQGHPGRRQRAQQDHIHAHRHEARGQRRLQHVAGEPGVLADHHAMAMVATGEMAPCRETQPQRHLGRHRWPVCGTANAVGAEQLAGGHGLRQGATPRQGTEHITAV